MNTRDAAELRRAEVRLAVQFTALIVLLLALMGVLLTSIVAASTAESTRRTLADAARIDSPRDAPLGVFVALLENGRIASPRVAPPGLPDTEAMRRVAETGMDERETMSMGERTYDVLTAARDDQVVQAAVDTHEQREALGRLVWAVVFATVAAALLAAGSSVWMARRAMRPLAESLALQRRFVADASHELRTPLTLLSTRAQLLRRKLSGADAAVPGPVVAAEVSRIVEDSKLLTGILDDMLIAADPRHPADHTIVDLVTIAGSAVELAAPQAVQRNIALTLADTTGPVRVQGSPMALQRVFTSLISNALDHAHTAVGVAVTVRGNDARIVVSDDGPGFPPGTEKLVLERFSSARPEAGDPEAPRHYGLGLALAAEIAAHHHGTLQINSNPLGGGGSVTVILPLAGS